MGITRNDVSGQVERILAGSSSDPVSLLTGADITSAEGEDLFVSLHGVELTCRLFEAKPAGGVVLVASPSAVGRLAWAERVLAKRLVERRLTTLLVDLLTEDEDVGRDAKDDVPLLADRLLSVVRWWRRRVATPLPMGYVGVRATVAAAIVAAATEPDGIAGIVGQRGRPERSGAGLFLARAPMLLLASDADPAGCASNQAACGNSRSRRFCALRDCGEGGDGWDVDRFCSLAAPFLATCLTGVSEVVPERRA